MNDMLRQMSRLALKEGSRQRFGSNAVKIASRAASNWASPPRASPTIQTKFLPRFSDVTNTNYHFKDVSSSSNTICKQQHLLHFSSTSSAALSDAATQIQGAENINVLSATNPSVISNELGEQYGVLLDTRRLPKLKPSVVKRRLDKLHTYIGTEKGIRQSPWKLNRVCQLAAGLTLEEALTQLQFCDVKNADLVAKVLRRTSNLADIRHGLQMSQLEVVECFTTKGMMLKRIKRMGRGRHGIMHHKFSHIRVVLREIDFKLKIYQAKTLNQKKKWLAHQMRADADGKAAAAKRKEMEELLKQQEQQAKERSAKKE